MTLPSAHLAAALTGWMLILCTAGVAAEPRVELVGGNGQAAWAGDGGPAVEAGIGGPFGLVIGPDGALYVCATENHAIRRIDVKTGRITTVAGSGKKGYAGDGGLATEALCNEPYEIRFDAAGDMFFVEMQNHLVRKVDAKSGKISTVAGTGKPGYSGDGGPATAATLKVPHSIALDGKGRLFIADIGNHRVRVVDLKTGVISTFAGTGEPGPTKPDAPALSPIHGPRALDCDGRTLLLGLREGHAIFKLDLAEPRLSHLAGTGKPGYTGDGGPAGPGQFNGPKGIAFGPKGEIVVADTENHAIRVIRPDGTLATLVGDGRQGDGPDGDPTKCRLNRPHGVFVGPAGEVYIGDSSNHRVRVWRP